MKSFNQVFERLERRRQQIREKALDQSTAKIPETLHHTKDFLTQKQIHNAAMERVFKKWKRQ